MAELQVMQGAVMELEGGSVQEMTMRLAEMKSKLGLVQRFFKEIMVSGQDYGVIPGTDKPTLLKPGAEKLCELYGYAPTVTNVDEIADKDSGFYRARVTVALVHRRTGVLIAEGVGEANTHEGRYRWRWVPEWKLPMGIDRESLYCEERKSKNGNTFLMYKIENDDPWTLWNTVLKMAKKRALVDAALSATRSSGLFTQDVEDLQEWVAAGRSDHSSQTGNGNNNGGGQQRTQQRSQAPKDPNSPSTESQQKAIHTVGSKKGIKDDSLKLWLKDRFGTEHTSELTKGQASECIDYLQKVDPKEIEQKITQLTGKQGEDMSGQQIDFSEDDIPF